MLLNFDCDTNSAALRQNIKGVSHVVIRHQACTEETPEGCQPEPEADALTTHVLRCGRMQHDYNGVKKKLEDIMMRSQIRAAVERRYLDLISRSCANHIMNCFVAIGDACNSQT